ncbi:uncharacterized protein YnbD-like isoform X2 [Zingiber officinale]|uniref:uncharacterized protein YnbD-like isoform X2 n=1 Tax=Zingiber officinale TaxID=94328 RepID=UPI001C4AD046|nr:uncharacterized protein YnbD-like isoform X2 [Zingiber officinale]
MGISKVMGCVSTILLSTSVYLKKSGRTYTAVPLLLSAVVGYTVSIASHPAVNLPLILGKSSHGSFPLWSKFLFAPYLLTVRVYTVFKRMKRRESLYDEIVEGLYLGGWPTSLSRLPPGDPVVIDCTCELPRTYFVPAESYLCIPLWDSRSPDPTQIECAVRWGCQKRSEKKPVYIHCANGPELGQDDWQC